LFATYQEVFLQEEMIC